jgi:predicted Zn finger-like uncharacterized protein
MQLTCPSCGTKFSVPEGALGEAGRSVKCSKCQHVWHATAESEPPEQIGDSDSVQAASSVVGGDVGLQGAEAPKPGNPAAAHSSNRLEVEEYIAPVKAKTIEEPLPAWDRPIPGVEIEPPPEPKRPWTRVIVALVLLLIVAASYVFRNEIVVVLPDAKRIYSLAGIPLRQAGEGLTFVDLASGTAIDNPDMLRVTGFIQNPSDMRLRIPPVRIVVYDSAKNTLADVVREAPTTVIDPRDLQRFSYDLPAPVKPLQGLFVDVLFTWN